jgi:hypothetical protein
VVGQQDTEFDEVVDEGPVDTGSVGDPCLESPLMSRASLTGSNRQRPAGTETSRVSARHDGLIVTTSASVPPTTVPSSATWTS